MADYPWNDPENKKPADIDSVMQMYMQMMNDRPQPDRIVGPDGRPLPPSINPMIGPIPNTIPWDPSGTARPLGNSNVQRRGIYNDSTRGEMNRYLVPNTLPYLLMRGRLRT